MNEVDVAETEAKIAAYEMENKDSIAANQAKNANEQRFRSFQDELEKKEREQKREEYLQQLEEERKIKEIEKSDIISELATTNKSAQAVIQTRQATALKRSSALRQSDSGTNGGGNNRLSMPSWITTAMDTDAEMRESEARNFDPLALQYQYTTGYTVRENYIDPSTEYLHNNKQTRAGGFAPKFAHQRALMSAFTGLLCQPIE
ncbi:hypothetical protein HPULCUR_000211 [Helicostylum pulchrum]|uniref:Cdk-activating kinase assembly factor MAT1 centre domain-containing protein n=1 Tax=Helicostylum pulchrum TaxID=562976 RepID=A0ABP9XJ80_9FUNG